MKKTEKSMKVENKKQDSVKCSLEELITMAGNSAVMLGSIQNGSCKATASISLNENKK